jgi:RHS repeat-associated protein
MRTQTNYPNGVSLFFTYDASNRTTRVIGKKPASGAILTDFSYEWKDAAGFDRALRQSVTDKTGNKTTYTYDQLNRLKTAEERSSVGALLNSYLYSYDANSNRTRKTENGAMTTCTYNAVDEMTSLTSGGSTTTYSYDANGNDIGHSGGRSFEYNAKDQLIKATPAGGSPISMGYTDTRMFKRVSAGSTTFVTSSLLGLGREHPTFYTRDDEGILVSMHSIEGTFYFLYDGLGSTAALTDSSGNIAATYKYEPFGTVTASTGAVTNPYRFLAAYAVYVDPTPGWLKMGTRYYAPSLGRFGQRDPIKGGALNAYDYAAQDPINIVDPDGTLKIWCVGWGAKKVCRWAKRAVRSILRKGRRAVKRVPPRIRRFLIGCATGAFGAWAFASAFPPIFIAGWPFTPGAAAVLGCAIGGTGIPVRRP